MPYNHVPAMLEESVHFLKCKPGKVIADVTLGGFGHASLICDKIKPTGVLIGIDQDIDAIRNAEKIIKTNPLKIYIKCCNFVKLDKFLKEIKISSLDGILLDVGISLHQIRASGRGFSFMKDEPLDMRMSIQNRTTATMILATLKEKELAGILRKYGEERWSNRIAHHLVKAREITPIITSGQLSYLVKQAIPKRYIRNQKIHPATRVFMALRIAVNQELKVLDIFLKKAIKLLNPGGRLCVMSFHSLEDKIVKRTFNSFENPCECPPSFPICACNLSPSVQFVTRKVIRPSKEEIMKNPMARSTRLRVIEKL